MRHGHVAGRHGIRHTTPNARLQRKFGVALASLTRLEAKHGIVAETVDGEPHYRAEGIAVAFNMRTGQVVKVLDASKPIAENQAAWFKKRLSQAHKLHGGRV